MLMKWTKGYLWCFSVTLTKAVLFVVYISTLVCQRERVMQTLWRRFKQSCGRSLLVLHSFLAWTPHVSIENQKERFSNCLDEEIKQSWSICVFICTAGIFDVLAYTDKDAMVPMTWADSDAKIIENPQVVKLRSFDRKVYKIFSLFTCVLYACMLTHLAWYGCHHW